jgi:hypothetical protein
MEDDDFLEFNDHQEDDDSVEERFKKAHRLMFINDVERFSSQPIPMGVEEFTELFNYPTEEDLDILTQCFMKSYLKSDIDDDTSMALLIDKWGLDWLECFIKHNINKEEYELCSILKDVIDVGKKQIDMWKAESLLQQVKDEINKGTLGE